MGSWLLWIILVCGEGAAVALHFCGWWGMGSWLLCFSLVGGEWAAGLLCFSLVGGEWAVGCFALFWLEGNGQLIALLCFWLFGWWWMGSWLLCISVVCILPVMVCLLFFFVSLEGYDLWLGIPSHLYYFKSPVKNSCQSVSYLAYIYLTMRELLTGILIVTTLWANPADDKLMRFFFFFF